MKNTNYTTTTTFLASQKRIILTISAFLLSIVCMAQKEETKYNASPYFLVKGEGNGAGQMPLKSTQVNVNIVGVIADVTITQVYKNESTETLEAIYTFPASSNSAVYAMEMLVGTRKITAKIEEKNKARKEYNQAKEEGKRASLLEQQRPNVFQMNVANIMPGDQIEVQLKYTEMIIPEEGEYKFVYPTVVGPRYVSKGEVSSDFTSVPYQKANEKPMYTFDINVNIIAGMPVQDVKCPTHKVFISYPDIEDAAVSLDPANSTGGNRDFVLSYKLTGEKIQSGLMLYEHKDENFFMLMVQPPKRIVSEQIPPREYIFIIDVSGSMRGFPLTVTKALMRNLIINLRPTDKFNVMLFAGTSGWMSEESVPATIENIEKANHFIDTQQGGGGTNILPALEKALTFPRFSDDLSRSFVVVTDGYVSVEKNVFDLIRNNNDQANLFAFGIGSSVNRHLIEGMSHVGMSEPIIVLEQAKADGEAERFRKYINTPVLTNVKKEFDGFDVYDVGPVTIPDVMAERPIIIYGKYKGDPKGSITIKGNMGNGKKYKKIFTVDDVKPDKENVALRYLWARMRIQMLDDYCGVGYDNGNEAELTSLGLKYNLLTAYTSFLAIEEDRIANEGKLKTVKQALPMPQGVPNSAVGFEMEVGQVELPYSFHRDIQVTGNLLEVNKNYVIEKLEKTLIERLNDYFNACFVTVTSIKVQIDGSGIIIKSKISGNELSQAQECDILNIINAVDFASFNISEGWEFTINY